MIYIILIAVYLLSAFLAWKHVNIAHSKGGRWSNVDIDLSDVLFIICPVLNTLYTVASWILFYPREINKVNFNKFFNIKK